MGQLFVWIVIGIIAGSVASAIVTQRKIGFGVPANLLLGMIGAVIGGFFFKAFGLAEGLDALSISVRDILSAVIGSLIVLLSLWLKRRSP